MNNSKANKNGWYRTILEQLDDYAKEYDFPMLNNCYFDFTDIHLTVFRNSEEWLIVFEEIGVSKKTYAFTNFECETRIQIPHSLQFT